MSIKIRSQILLKSFLFIVLLIFKFKFRFNSSILQFFNLREAKQSYCARNIFTMALASAIVMSLSPFTLACFLLKFLMSDLSVERK